MPQSLRRLLINFSLLVGSTFSAILLVEGVLRFIGLDKPLVWTPHPELGWHHIPKARRLWTSEGKGLIEINSLGYRDRERQLVKSPTTFRILVLGDSMTEGVQVNLEQTFCYILEERLRKNGRSVEVLNFGINGYSPIQELLLFKREGSRYSPDLVILAVFLDNDVAGVHPNLIVGSHSGAPFLRGNKEPLSFDYSRSKQSFEDYHKEPFYSLRKYSAIYRFVGEWRWNYKLNKEVDHTSQKGIKKRYLLYQMPIHSLWEEAWFNFERVMLEFSEEVRRQKAQLIVLSIPAGQVINGDVWKTLLQSSPEMSSINWDLEYPENRLKDFANKHNILLLQPYKAYQMASKDPPLFFGDVGHMTPRGHQIMAEIIEDFLYRHGLIFSSK